MTSAVTRNNYYYNDTGPTKYFPPDYDIGISFLYTSKIPESELTKPWINFHPGPLPMYRGRNVIYHAIMNQEKEFGGTIHFMDKNFDTGDIIDVERFPIEESDTAGDILEKTYKALSDLYWKYIWDIVKDVNSLPRKKQTGGQYYHKSPINEEIILDEIDAIRVKALTVHPKFHAYTVIGDRKYKLVPEDK